MHDMSKQGHTPIPRYRAFAGPPVFSQGFRPFFLLAGIWAIVALALSFEMVQGRIDLPTAFDAISWHYHEMLFGYVAATIAGFSLTMIPNWTGHLPLQGIPLLMLVLLWIAGRVAVGTSGIIGAWPAALIDLSFLLALCAVSLREIVAGRSWRNLPIIMAIILFLICNALSHAEAVGLVESNGVVRRLAVTVVVSLITLVGGRIIPSFTRNWLARRGAAKLPASLGNFDRLTLAATMIALAYWAFLPNSLFTAILTGLAAALNLLRLARWCGPATYPEPLLWVLHIGYFWIPIGLALLSLNWWWPEISQTGALHALTVGAVGTMTLAVMSRATLQHTGRAIHAGAGLSVVFVLITLAAITRVGSAFWAESSVAMLNSAAVVWIAAFAVYLCVCGPMLIVLRTPRRK